MNLTFKRNLKILGLYVFIKIRYKYVFIPWIFLHLILIKEYRNYWNSKTKWGFSILVELQLTVQTSETSTQVIAKS